MKGARHKAREIALQVLYEVDSVGHDPEETLNRFLPTQDVSNDIAFFPQLVCGVIDNGLSLIKIFAILLRPGL